VPPAAERRNALRNLWRIRRYIRPYASVYVWVTLAGCVATGVAIAIPLIVQNIVDGPIARGDPSGLWLLGGFALVFGVAEAVLNF